MSAVSKLPTGVAGLDLLLHGGIPEGRATLLAGKSGTCKTVLALQIASNLARHGHSTLLVAVEESAADLVTTGDDLGFGLSDLVTRGALRIADVVQPMEGPTVVTGDYDLSGLTHRIERAARDHGVRAVVLDSATALFNPVPADGRLRSLFFQLIHTLRKADLTAVITAEAPADYGPLTALGIEDFVCDAVVILRNVVDGERRRRSIEVHKYRRSGHYKGEYPCTITAKGLTVFPLDAGDRTEAAQGARLPSGLAGLDAVTSGGWLRDSIVLLRGPSGSGKTTLAGMYARAGAERGERVVYYGFEETRPILLRNFASMGMPLDELERGGHLRVQCRYSEATSPEDLLVDLRADLDSFRPSVVVLDSISSIEHANSPRGFRQFMVGVASLLREHGRSALLTQTVPGNLEAELNTPYLSTIADAIVVLGYSANDRDLRRTLRVLKMRGSAHSTEQHRIEIAQSGLRVEPARPRRTPRQGAT